MLTSRALLVPPLPTIVVDQRRGHRTEMILALAAASERFLAESPAAAVVLSARWEAPGPFLVDAGRRHATITDYAGFGVELRYDCPGRPALARALAEAGRSARVRVATGARGADSGVTVPMHFLAPAGGVPVVPLSVARLGTEECRAWGKVLRAALAAWPERVAFVVGGALSRNAHAWSLRREVPEASVLDERVLDALRTGAWGELGGCEAEILEKARPEAGLRHLEVLRGFLADETRGEVLAYESAHGVGGALVAFPTAVAAEESPRPPDH